ncbi:MAG: Gmad2 immunoglobulin-like domain-containing protein [Actinomycetota bacterium]
MRRIGIVLATLALAASACSARTPNAQPSGTTSAEPTASPATFAHQVWFNDADGKLLLGYRTAAGTPAVARAAITSMLDGPTSAERAQGTGTSIPVETKLVDLNIADRVATVDLSSEFEASGGTLGERLRLAQVVFTLTQFDTVTSVSLRIDGRAIREFGSHGLVLDRPSTRDDFEDLMPAIVVEHPIPGDRVSSPVTVSGTANVFEATVSLRILDAGGKEIATTFTNATCGTGCRGTYSVNVTFEVAAEQQGTIEVFVSSAKDGKPTDVVRVPVILTG